MIWLPPSMRPAPQVQGPDEPAEATSAAEKKRGSRLAHFAAMEPPERFEALKKLDPTDRARLLGASSLSCHLHDTGPAYEYPWNDFRLTSAHSSDQAWAAAITSKRVYEPFGKDGNDPTRVGKGFADLARAGFTMTFLRGAGGTHAALACRGEDAIVSIRGTDPRVIADLIKDADALPTPHRDGGRAHNGFQGGLAEVSEKLLSHLDDARRIHRGLKVMSTGHSLGAAMATLAALDLKREGFDVASVYPFGSPRVVSPSLRAVYKERGLDACTYRYRKCWDGVVDVPLPPLYEHVGTELYFNSSGALLVNPSASTVRADKFVAMQSAFAKQFVLRGEPEMLWDHGPGGYVKHAYVNRDVQLQLPGSR